MICREPNEREAAAFVQFVRLGNSLPRAAMLASEPGAGETLTASAFRRHARRWPKFAEAFEDAQADRKAKRVEFVESRLEENVERAMQAVPVLDRDGNETGEWRYEGSVANRGLELLGKTVGLFGDTAQVEVNHSGQVLVTHERRLTLADLAGFARTLDGPVDGARGELPAARPVLAEPGEGESAAGGVPVRHEA